MRNLFIGITVVACCLAINVKVTEAKNPAKMVEGLWISEKPMCINTRNQRGAFYFNYNKYVYYDDFFPGRYGYEPSGEPGNMIYTCKTDCKDGKIHIEGKYDWYDVTVIDDNHLKIDASSRDDDMFMNRQCDIINGVQPQPGISGHSFFKVPDNQLNEYYKLENYANWLKTLPKE